ncbi:hypothetical protein KL938_003988 [Ogataea parapolymorpha]|nr:hypothetical protein KL938_003988 [Ogataea parapolymorpha]
MGRDLEVGKSIRFIILLVASSEVSGSFLCMVPKFHPRFFCGLNPGSTHNALPISGTSHSLAHDVIS